MTDAPTQTALETVQASREICGCASLGDVDAIRVACEIQPEDWPTTDTRAIGSAITELVRDEKEVHAISITTTARDAGSRIAGVLGEMENEVLRHFGAICQFDWRRDLIVEAAIVTRRMSAMHRLNLMAKDATISSEEWRILVGNTDIEGSGSLVDSIVVSEILNAPVPPPPLWTRGPAPCTYGVVAGEGDTSKSYWMLSMAASIATGHVTLPSFTPSVMGPVVYLAYEDSPSTMLFRLKAIAAASNMPFSSIECSIIDRRLTLICHPEGPLFVTDKTGTNKTSFFHRFDSVVRDMKPVLTIIDPLSGAARLRSENDNSEMSAISQQLADFGVRQNVAVLLVQHANKGGEQGVHSIRGASALKDRARWATLMYRTDIENQVVVKVVKDNLYGCHDTVVLARSEGGALTTSELQEGRKTTKPSSKVILKGAVKQRESEKGIQVLFYVGFPGNSKDEIPRTEWFPRKQIRQEGEQWLAEPWIILKKEEQIAKELGVGACKILVGAGGVVDAPTQLPKDAVAEEEELF